jgi:DNA-binding MarR family transcriptional regulator
MGGSGDFRALARELQQTCLGFRVRRLNRRVTRLYEDALRPHGIRIAQLNILVALGLRDTWRSSDIARALDLERSTLSRNLDRLITRKWVAVGPAAEDRSVQVLRLTASGRRAVEKAIPAWREAQAHALARIEAELADVRPG